MAEVPITAKPDRGMVLMNTDECKGCGLCVASCRSGAIRLRGFDDAQMLVLLHRDPSLSIPLCVSSDPDEIASAWQTWSDIFALPQLEEAPSEPAPRRRRRNTIRARRPKFLVRRRGGGALDAANVHRGEREIIARN